MSERKTRAEAFGANDWLIDEMFRQYLEDPTAVSERWREFFKDYEPRNIQPVQPRPRRVSPDGDEEGRWQADETVGGEEAEAPSPSGEEDEDRGTDAELPEGAEPLRGAAATLARNMEASLGVPTATSVRTVPAKLLEENRRILNDCLVSTGGGKISFTHIVGWAIVKALTEVPALNAIHMEADGRRYVVRNEHVNLGLAVDVQRSGGTRTLLVPNIKRADTLDFAGFHAAYEEAIRKVRTGKLDPDDFSGTTVTLTNPGMIGTGMSVPRLMAGQGAIIGTGAIDYPTEYRGADPGTLAALGVGKVMTVTSTYDHRIIQGAESGQFLDVVSDLLCGGERFYEELFESLNVPYEPVRWSRDRAAPLATGAGPDSVAEKNARVFQLINMYRVRGHLIADLNPLSREARRHIELDPQHHGLGVWDLDREFLTGGLGDRERATLREILDTLRRTYSHTAGIEYMHIQEADEKRWIQEHVEGVDRRLEREDKIYLLQRLNAAEAFERFLHTKYVGHKRFSLEGAESLIPMLDWLLDAAADAAMKETVMGMAHRGRLNVLTKIVGKPYEQIFREFEGDIDPESTHGSGDVKYHLGATGSHTSRKGNEIAVLLASNPSHLEAVNPIVEGIARARQDQLGWDAGKDTILPVLIHGDAAFAGQGVVQETLNLSQLSGYKTGGTVHIVVNNAIGFTAGPEATRSSVYPTDVAKMVQAPIFHVNGDDPEACVWVMAMAFAYRQAFHKDVVVDLMCYRRHGHNEADEPAYTQPIMYAQIERHRSVRKLYTEALVNNGDLSLEEAEDLLGDFRAQLEEAFERTRSSAPPEPREVRRRRPTRGPLEPVPTGADEGVLRRVAEGLTTIPEGFTPHPKLERLLRTQREAFEKDQISWPLAEALAWGSLVREGRTVRLSGQDSRRGTFSQRHSVLIDQRTEEEYVPLTSLEADGGRFLPYDSLLSEYAAVGFEYGYAVGDPDALVMWEAQFGDFINGAQVVVDQYLVSSETKWGQKCGVVLLLPHGYEGQGPEHSSARLERFLTLSAEDNIQVSFPTTASQYFHLLRRQVHMEDHKPLVVLTPKGLLRHPAVRCSVADLSQGHFREVLPDPDAPDPDRVRRVVLCTGKIAVELLERREKLGIDAAAIVRVEQLYPFPYQRVEEQLGSYPNADEVIWVQEEPENMGAWSFVFGRLARQLPGLQVVARPPSASPAAGSGTVHGQEQEELLEGAFEGLT